jgi:hypothetical protein
MTRANPRLSVFVVVFAAAFALIYVLAVDYNWALFTYGPATGEIGPLVRPASAGPTMYWYGWLLTAALGAAALAALASFVPLSRRLWPCLSWAVPICVILAFGYILRGYFLR